MYLRAITRFAPPSLWTNGDQKTGVDLKRVGFRHPNDARCHPGTDLCDQLCYTAAIAACRALSFGAAVMLADIGSKPEWLAE
jgi:hypothetical protein